MKNLLAGALLGFILACIFFRNNSGTCFEWLDNDSDAPQCKVYWRALM